MVRRIKRAAQHEVFIYVKSKLQVLVRNITKYPRNYTLIEEMLPESRLSI